MITDLSHLIFPKSHAILFFFLEILKYLYPPVERVGYVYSVFPVYVHSYGIGEFAGFYSVLSDPEKKTSFNIENLKIAESGVDHINMSFRIDTDACRS